MWQKVESDEDVLSGRPGGSRDHKTLTSGSGPSSGEGTHGSYSSRHQPHVPSYPPPPPMYFPYPMAPSMFTSAGGDARSISSHPYFSHLPRLGYSPAPLHLPPPSLHHIDGGGDGHYPRPGRPWWTVPPIPPPSHLHHPHHSHPPPTDSNYHRPISIQEQQPPPSSQETLTTTVLPEASTTSSVPRTSSRNAYSQQRLSILKKQQQQKEHASKNAMEQDKNQFVSSNSLKLITTGVSSKLKLGSEGDNVTEEENNSKEDKGVQKMEIAKMSSKSMTNQ